MLQPSLQCKVFVQVEAMQRRAAYERDQLLARIQSDTEKAHDLLAQRTALQEQRRAANMEASFQRQKLLQARPQIRYISPAVWFRCRCFILG